MGDSIAFGGLAFRRKISPVVAPPTVPEFSPQRRVDCLSWFDGRAGLTLDGVYVTNWADQGTLGLHLEQATADSRPYAFAEADFKDQVCVTFDGFDDNMTSTIVAAVNAQPMRFYFCGSIVDTSLIQYIYDQNPTDPGARQAFLLNSGIDAFAGSEVIGAPGDVPAANAPCIICAVFDGASTSIYLDDATTPIITGDSSTNGFESLTLGARYSLESFFGGKIAAVGWFSGAGDADERAGMFAGLRARYVPEPVVGPLPVVTNVHPVQYPGLTTGFQDPAGGSTIIVSGSNFVNGCTVSFQQMSTEVGVSSLVMFSGGGLTVTTPALPAGVYDIVVINPDTGDSGSSGAAKHESWEPIVENPSLLLMPGDYSMTGTQGVDAAGVWLDSSTNGYDMASPPGSTFAPDDDGFGNPVFTPGYLAYLTNTAADMSGLVAGNVTSFDNGTVIAFSTPSEKRLEAADYLNTALVAGAGATPNLALSSKGFKCVGYNDSDGLYHATYSNKGRVGAAQLAMIRWDSSVNEVQVNDNAPVSASIPGSNGFSATNMGVVEVGRNYSGSQPYGGQMSMVAILPAKASDAVIKKFYVWGILTGHLPTTYFELNGSYYHFLDASIGATLANGDTELAGLLDLGGSGDSNKNLATGGGGTNPAYIAVDSDFGGQPSWGTTGNEDGKWMVTGAFASPLATARTAYQVMMGGSAGTGNYYVRINNGGSGVGCSLYAVPTDINYNASTGGASISLPIPVDTAGVSCIVYNGASSEGYWNRYGTPDATGDTGDPTASAYESLGTGSFPLEASSYKQCLIIVDDTVHNEATRLQWMACIAERFQLPLTAAG
jgi:hypothetical protein